MVIMKKVRVLRMEGFVLITPLQKIYEERIINWIEDDITLNYQRQKHCEKYGEIYHEKL